MYQAVLHFEYSRNSSYELTFKQNTKRYLQIYQWTSYVFDIWTIIGFIVELNATQNGLSFH